MIKRKMKTPKQEIFKAIKEASIFILDKNEHYNLIQDIEEIENKGGDPLLIYNSLNTVWQDKLLKHLELFGNDNYDEAFKYITNN